MKEFERYRVICRWLSPIPGTGSEEMQRVRDKGLWAELLDAAGRHYVSPLLAGRLQEKGLYGQLPSEVRDYLDALRQLNKERNDTLKAELLDVIRLLNALGVEPLLLKGAINLVSEQYPGCEDRVIGDLDLAVPRNHLETCFRRLSEVSYEPHSEFMPEHTTGGHHHAPALLHESLPVCVELHNQILGNATREFLSTEETWQHSSRHLLKGAFFRLPDPASRLIHTFTHTQLQDHNHARRSIALRPLCEFVNQRVAFESTLDWGSITRKIGTRHLWILETYLQCAFELFGQQPPAETTIGFRARLRMPFIRACVGSRTLCNTFGNLQRLKRLPRRLVTPSWYPAKYQALRRGERL